MKTSTLIFKIFSIITLVIYSFSVNAQELTLEDSLVAYYPFNGNANDESGNGNDGTVNGPVLTTDRFGNPDAAYLFDGSDHIYVNSSASLNTSNNSGTTVCAWLRYDNNYINNPSIVYYGVSNGQPAFANILSDTLVRASNFTSQAIHGDCYSTTKIYSGDWYFISNVYDDENSLIKVFVNGQFEAEQTYGIANPNNPHLEIGRDPYAGGSQYFNGVIDDIRVYSRTLSDIEINSLFQEGGSVNGNITFTKQTSTPFVPVNYASNRNAKFVDVNNDGLLDVFFSGSTNTSGTSANTSIYLNNGDDTFTSLSNLPFANTYGNETHWADYNNDGFIDLVLTDCNMNGQNTGQIYKNNGDNTFTAVYQTPPFGGTGQWCDLDSDGTYELLIGGNLGTTSNIKVIKHLGNDIFIIDESYTFPSTNEVSRIASFDYNLDGYIDLIIRAKDASDTWVSMMYGNNGDFSFSEIGNFNILNAGLFSVADYNNDGYLDIYQNDAYVYLNNLGDGSFSQVGLSSVIAMAGGSEWGDYNNDGRPDILACGSMATVIDTKVYRNEGNDTFSDIQPGITSLAMWNSVKWGDCNNDGYLDFIIAGYLHSSPYRAAELWKSEGGEIPNTAPTMPLTLSSNINGNEVILAWDKASDSKTNQNALTYNVRVGTTPGGNEILSCSSDEITGFRRIAQIGNAGTSLNYILKNLDPGTYYWSAQAIDQAYAGGLFADEESFTITDPINDCLVAWYPFNGNADDESGNENNGTINGPVLTADRFGNPNSAYFFDGSNDYIHVNNSTSISGATYNSTTISGWVKASSYSAPGNMLIFLGGNYTMNSYEVYYQRIDNKITAMNYKWQGPWQSCLSTFLPDLDVWYFLTSVFDNDNSLIKLYINGILNNELIVSLNKPVNPLLEIGRNPWPESYHHGVIDDVRIFNCALDSAQIWQLFTIDGILFDMPDTLMACHNETIVLDAGAGYSSYLWSSGETTQTILASETRTYIVTVEDDFGNTATDSTYVNIINAHIVQNDTTICAGESIELLVIGGSTANITDGLVAWYPFNGNAEDESGNGHTGIVDGATITTDRFGVNNSAFYFDGSNNIKANIGAITTRSISFWYKSDYPVQSWPEFYQYNNSYCNMIGLGGPLPSDHGKPYMRVQHANNNAHFVMADTLPLFNQWHNVIVQYEQISNNIYLYVDNNLQGIGEYTSSGLYVPGYNNNVITFGAAHSLENGHFLTGFLDDIRIYNRILSEEEIETLYYEGAGNYSYLWSTNDTTSTISVSPTETTTYYVEITDGINWCTDSVTVTVEHPFELELKAFLEGPFLSTNMLRYLNLLGFMPLEQPYNVEPWNYNGDEAVTEIPFLAVDWVLVELRDTEGDVTTATSDKVIARKACFIQNDGIITDLDGSSPFSIDAEINNNVYVVVYHRNHLPVISANPLEFNAGIYEYDFTEFPEQVYGGVRSCVEVGVDTWGMASGDGNNSKEINNLDKNDIWLPNRGSVGYNIADYNLDGQVNTSDKVVSWEPNSGKGSKIPD